MIYNNPYHAVKEEIFDDLKRACLPELNKNFKSKIAKRLEKEGASFLLDPFSVINEANRELFKLLAIAEEHERDDLFELAFPKEV